MSRSLWLLVALGVSACEAKELSRGGFAALSAIPAAEDSLGDSDTFGSIDGLSLLGSGRIVVADAMNGRISLFFNGELVAQAGSRGQGPREFRRLGSIAALGDTLLALDPLAGRLFLHRIGDDSLIWLGSVQLSFPAQELCTVGSQVFVHGQYEGKLVHQMTLEGEIVRSYLEEHTNDSSPLETR